jgi:hypothetical protein
VPSFIDALNARIWTDAAACADYPTPDDFFVEGKRGNHYGDPPLRSRRALDALECCAQCPVRRECLGEALKPVVWQHPKESGHIITRSTGIFGGTVYSERLAVSDLPVGEAVQLLEAGLEERLAARRKMARRS